ncbi:Vitamin B12 import ATP-binding protein BtuD [Paenibacillus sp. JJ-100]|uniref:ABC transporter ATP-binding protein n=1 Tax=Paenibacillus sp. JJ-100 TaxID=2974896 RepID=UPI0022FF54D2|nr:ABC transporter ATP-binding protein [Paenibacillus sp. JJ-100]CAI6082461.1 Vitamin B12 import ATP-binding protein BtuD [Paenibacillus sp. JJ-100]
MNAIELRNVSKSYPLFKVDNISMDVKQGFITGLIGPNGAGKSTLIKMITGLIHPDQGTLRTLGRDMANNEVAVKQRLGIVSDECFYYEHLTIRETASMIAPFYSRWNHTLFKNYLEQFELSPKKKIRDLSKGMKIKFSLAVALSHEADLLVMDEPTSGLDPVFRRELLDLLAGMIQDETKSIIFSTHITTDLERIADYIAFVHRGKLIFNEAKDDVLERYTIVKGDTDLLDADTRRHFVGIRETKVGFEALSDNKEEAQRLFGDEALLHRPALEDLIYFTAKGGHQHA